MLLKGRTKESVDLQGEMVRCAVRSLKNRVFFSLLLFSEAFGGSTYNIATAQIQTLSGGNHISIPNSLGLSISQDKMTDPSISSDADSNFSTSTRNNTPSRQASDNVSAQTTGSRDEATSTGAVNQEWDGMVELLAELQSQLPPPYF
jgi:hypothetical protein